MICHYLTAYKLSEVMMTKNLFFVFAVTELVNVIVALCFGHLGNYCLWQRCPMHVFHRTGIWISLDLRGLFDEPYAAKIV
jgi:hypothetical protein